MDPRYCCYCYMDVLRFEVHPSIYRLLVWKKTSCACYPTGSSLELGGVLGGSGGLRIG